MPKAPRREKRRAGVIGNAAGADPAVAIFE